MVRLVFLGTKKKGSCKPCGNRIRDEWRETGYTAPGMRGCAKYLRMSEYESAPDQFDPLCMCTQETTPRESEEGEIEREREIWKEPSKRK